MKSKTKPIRFSIRTKLFLLSIVFLAVPYTAYRSLLELETSLRQSLESSLLDVGHSLAALLADKEELLRNDLPFTDNNLFVHELKQPVNLDGYNDEWVELMDWSNNYQSDEKPSFSYHLILAHQHGQLYALLDVKDSTPAYYDPGQLREINSDHVSMVFSNNADEIIRYEFAPEGQGSFFPFQLEKYWLYEEDKEFMPPELRKVFITNSQGHWQQTANGYTLELAIPWHMQNGRLGFIVHDYDNSKPLNKAVSLGTSGSDTGENPNVLIQQSQELNQIINRLGLTKSRRIWVLDTLSQVVAVDGSIKNTIEKTPVNIFYEIIFPKANERFWDDLTEASRLEGKEIKIALEGDASTRWRSSVDDKAVILSAAVPVKKNNKVLGVVVVEETTNSIQILKRNALAKLFNQTLLVFTVVTLLLLLFTSRISYRLRRLSKQSDEAIDEYGRVVGDIKASDSNDELGELSRNYSSILKRLKQYHEYLEGMAGKLSHELRTPMAVVQSSLENLELEPDKAVADEYLKRAKEGISQLNHLLTRLSEATRLEQSLQNSEFEKIDLCQLLKNCVSGYKDAFHPVTFQFETELSKLYLRITPDLIVQMLDKLISNAVDFHNKGTPIIIQLAKQKQITELRVINQGAIFDDEIKSQLFQSLISKRDRQDNQEPHLGLGLYIVRLIAEFHGGRVSASNLADGSGVCFSVKLPIQ